jgi:selenocysteine lyase/cysteine desulfurase
LEQHGGDIKLFSVTGASNVVGTLLPIHELATICHEYGAKIMVDAAQLVPHCQVDMKPPDDPEHIDFLAFSAHKMYAPFGAGVLIAPQDFLEQGDPAIWGGGAVAVVSEDEVAWLDSPEREEAGSPNVAGVVAMAAAMKTINAIGYDTLESVEEKLSRKFLDYLNSCPEFSVYGISDPNRINERLGVFTFNIDKLLHAKVAAILSYEHGVGVRNGCFCSHPFILQLLHVPETTATDIRTWLKEGNHSNIPGGIRVSFGLYNTEEELNRLIDAMNRIIEGKYSDNYREDPKDGAFHPTSITPEYHRFYTI